MKTKKQKETKVNPKAKGYLNKEGIGEAYVKAVGTASDELTNITDSFLGVAKKDIDVKEQVHTLDKKK